MRGTARAALVVSMAVTLAACAGTPATSGAAGNSGSGSGGSPPGSGGSPPAETGGSVGTGGTPATGGVPGTGGPGGSGGAAGAAAAGGGGATTSTGGSSGGSGGTAGGAGPSCRSGQPAASGGVVIDACTQYQRIRGFGASSAWNTLTASDHMYLWDTTQGAGLSMLRIRIDTTASTTSTSNAAQLSYAKIAAAKGVLVWASPWSPQTAWQTRPAANQLSMNFTYAQPWADQLATFAKQVTAMGIPLYAISSQNEPDGTNFNHFTAPQLVDWIKTYLGPALQGTGVKIVAPETVNWCSFPTYEGDILADATASAFVPIIATHEYGCSPKAFPAIQQAGKEFWETEIYESETTTDEGINSGLNTAKLMHEALTIANVNAWHYWWVHGGADTGLFTNTSSTPTKRLWVMGNFSRFVRPGYVRIGAPTAPTSGVTLSAYYGAADNRIVIVAIDTNTSATSQTFTVSGITPTKVTPWVTDGTNDLQAQPAVVPSGSGFTYAIPPRSVTSLVVDGG